ncbi:MAG TPA: hypothetical protein VJG90_08160 [Candidatus Nanoarchaeia archaeon]|nr:hypothetical protein [Candidatus Nanoarchaeia archaeon]
MEQNAFLDFVGDTPANRILDFLLTGRGFDYSLSELSRKAGVSWTTLHRIFPRLVKQQIIAQTRTIGRAKLYQLNLKNLIVRKYAEVYDAIILEQLRKAGEKETVKLCVSS